MQNSNFEKISKLHLEACALTSRLSAIFHTLSAVRFDSKEDSDRFDRFFRIQMKAYDRSHRRFLAYDSAFPRGKAMQTQLTSDDLLELRAQALRLANKLYEKLIDGSFPTFESRARARNVWMRLCARADRRALAFHKVFTQQIASAVEREAFPPAPVFVHESEYSFNDEYNQVIDYDEELENSGDTFAALPAGAPVFSLSHSVSGGVLAPKSADDVNEGQGSTFEHRAEQGSGSSSCQADNPFVGRFCECDQCAEDRSKYSDTAGFLFQSVFLA